MKYRNQSTGNVIEVNSRISGKDWVQVEEVKRTSSARPKKAKGKQDG